MNTSRSGSRSSWPSSHASRRLSTSGQSCSVACAVFFARDSGPVEELPQRADPDRRAAFGQQRLQLDQRNVVFRLDCAEDGGRVRVDPGRTTVAALPLGCRRAKLKDQLPPADRACRAYPNRAAAARHDIPPSTAATTHSPRSCESTCGTHAGLLNPAQSLDQKTKPM